MIDSVKGGFSTAINTATAGKAASGVKDGGFAEVLKDSIEKVNSIQGEADQAIKGLATGQVNNIHETMIAIEKANLSFNMMVQVRNKLVQAYEEIMRTQV
ncbi:MAG: flagellar hook-basal body complex protein FliE [Deltaproteobacteria bacterium]|jgi:flagellar hook-basal body complex protein FliE|nr:flagellar hook-basal body complex protein FliE [Deltaproteobacteria bacterium]